MSRPATSRLKCNPPLGSLPVLQYCTPAQLQIDASYQRSMEAPASRTLVRRIAVHWDWGLCQPLFVARRADGGLYVVDGQHRLEAARARGDVPQLPCVVTDYDSAGDEAAAFVALNQQRRPLNRMQIFKAALAAGDGEARVIQDALDEAGLWIGSSPDLSIQKPGAIVCLRGLEDCLHAHGKIALASALDVMAQSFKGEVLRYSGSIFPGITAIVADEVGRDAAFAEGERFFMMTDMIAATPQREWYAAVSAKTAEVPTRRSAAAALFREAWLGCLAAYAEAA